MRGRGEDQSLPPTRRNLLTGNLLTVEGLLIQRSGQICLKYVLDSSVFFFTLLKNIGISKRSILVLNTRRHAYFASQVYKAHDTIGQLAMGQMVKATVEDDDRNGKHSAVFSVV